MDTDGDLVLRQLRKLREGAGLTTARLERSGTVMSALGTSDPEQARQRLVQILDGLGDSERSRALKVDFGLYFAALVGREPVTRELEWLGERRSAYAEVVGRDVKTLGRWSDRAVAELRARLLNDTFTGHLYVVAAVKGERILSTSLIQEPLEATAEGIRERSSLDLDNSCDEPSIPCLIYAYPRDWRPATLTLAVVFAQEPYPVRIWGAFTDNILKLPFGEGRHEVRLDGGTAMCRFVRPRTNLIYGVWWVW